MKKKERFIFYIILLLVLAILVLGTLIYVLLIQNSGNDSFETIGFETEATKEKESTSLEDASTTIDENTEKGTTKPAQTDEITTKEPETEKETKPLPHERNGFWGSISHGKPGADANEALLLSGLQKSYQALRLYENEIETITFYNDTSEEITLYFYIFAGNAYLCDENGNLLESKDDKENETKEETKTEEETEEETKESIKDLFFEATIPANSTKKLTLTSTFNTTLIYSFAYETASDSYAVISDNASLEVFNSIRFCGTLTYEFFGKKASYETKNLVNIPYCDVIWEENKDEEGMARLCNLRSFNGKNLIELYGIGGQNKLAFTELELRANKNPWLSSDLSFEKEGNVYVVRIPYAIAQDSLYQAKLHYVLEDGYSVSFYGDGCNANGTFNLMSTWYAKITATDGSSHIYLFKPQRNKYEIPVVYITTNNKKPVTSKNNYLSGTFMMDAEHIEGISSIPVTEIGIKGRGHSTWKMNKKPYALKFNEKVSIMGLDKNKDWVLLANYFDPSNGRNYIAYEMAKELNFEFTPSSYPVDVFFNGVYIGVYCIGEKIEVASSRVDLKENNHTVDTDYLIEIGAFEKGQFTIGTMKGISISYPKPEEITKEQRSFVINYMNAANHAVKTLTNYEDYIDMDSFLDWFIMIELTYNCDSSFNRSVYITKKAGGKLSFQPVWDYDLAFGNLCILTPEYETWATTQNGFTEITWATYLIKDPHFRDLLEKRWREVSDTLLEKGLAACDQMSTWMNAGSGKENFDLWVVPGERIGWEWDFVMDYTTTEEHIDYIRRFLKMRKAYLDRIIIDREEAFTYIKPSEEETTAPAPEEETTSPETVPKEPETTPEDAPAQPEQTQPQSAQEE